MLLHERLRTLVVLRIERRFQPLGELARRANAPIVQEHHTWGFHGHVLMDGDDIDTSATQSFQDRLQFLFEHDKIAIHHRLIIAAGKGGPGVDAHGVADVMAVHLRAASDGELVHTVGQLALRAQDLLNSGGVQRGLGRIKVGLGDLTLATAGRFDLGKDFAYGARQGLLTAHTTDMHEHDLRGIPKEVIVQGRDLQPVGERFTHDWIHLIFEQYYVSHDQCLVTRLLKRRPRGETQGWCKLHAGHTDVEIAPWHTDFEDFLALVELAFGTRELLDLGRIESGFGALARPHTPHQAGTGHDDRQQGMCVAPHVNPPLQHTTNNTGPQVMSISYYSNKNYIYHE